MTADVEMDRPVMDPTCPRRRSESTEPDRPGEAGDETSEAGDETSEAGDEAAEAGDEAAEPEPGTEPEPGPAATNEPDAHPTAGEPGLGAGAEPGTEREPRPAATNEPDPDPLAMTVQMPQVPGPPLPASRVRILATALPRPMSGRRRWIFGLLVLVGLGLAAVTVGWSLIVGSVIAALTSPAVDSTQYVVTTAIRLLALALVTAWLVWLERVLAERFGQSWVNDVRVAAFERLSRVPVRENRQSTGSSTMRLVGDMSALRRWASLGLARLAVAVPLVLGCMVALLLAAPLMAAAVAGVILLGFGMTRAVTPRLNRTNRDARQRRSRMAAHVIEHVGNRMVMQAFGQENAERRQVRRQGQRLGEAMVHRAQMIGTVRAIGEATTLTASAAALVTALAVNVDAAAAGAALAVLAVLTTPLRDLSRVAEYRAASVVALEKLEELMRRPIRRQRTSQVQGIPDGPGRLEAHDVAVAGVFDRLHLTAEPGSVIAVVGPNGSGKTTLLTVLAGLVEPDEGRVLLDGMDLRLLDERELGKAVGLVAPDLPLLRGSIADNVRYGDPDADDAAVEEAITASGLDELLATLPDGLDTRVGEGGRGLSAGQRQRVALARAVLAKPRVLLLDEADAHLDPVAAGAVDRLVRAFTGTVVVVSHRPARLPVATAVWQLAEGRLYRMR